MFSPVHCGEGRVSRVSKIRGQCLGHIMDKSIMCPSHCLRILETLDTLTVVRCGGVMRLHMVSSGFQTVWCHMVS